MKNVIECVDRHGNVRIYYRVAGKPKIRIRSEPETEGFHEEIRKAREGLTPPLTTKHSAAKTGSFRSLYGEYKKSSFWMDLGDSTKRTRSLILDKFCENNRDGDKPYRSMKRRHVIKRRDELCYRDPAKPTPAAADELVKALSQVFNYAVDSELMSSNPCARIKKLNKGSTGYHTWTADEIAQFERRHPLGTTAHLALSLALYTSQRISDVSELGRQHIREGMLCFTQFKGRENTPIQMEIPVIPYLQNVIDHSPTGDLTFVQTAYGKAFSTKGLGNKMREWCDEAGLPHCSMHGLRKSCATWLADIGCSAPEIMAITGHKTLSEAQKYVDQADKKRRAISATDRMQEDKMGTK